MESAYPGKGYDCATPKVFSTEKFIIRFSKAFFTFVEWAEPTLHDHGVSYIQINTCSFTEIWKINLFIHVKQRFMFALRMCWFQRDWSWTVGTGITLGEGSRELICFAFRAVFFGQYTWSHLMSKVYCAIKWEITMWIFFFIVTFIPLLLLRPSMHRFSPLCRAVCFSIYFIKCVVNASTIVVC